MNLNDDKQAAFRAAFDKGRVRVVLDMTREGVVLPEAARQNSRDGRGLALDYSRTFHMPKFKVTDEGIGAVLSFDNAPHWTFVPWEAVLGLLLDGVPLEVWPTESVRLKFATGEEALNVIRHLRDKQAEEDPDRKWLSTTVAEG